MVHSFLPKFSSKFERRLLALCKNNPDENPEIKKWNKSAVQYIVKNLKKNIDTIEELEKAISQESSKTKCVLIPKTTDKRLLVSHRRGLPQVIYCRLWRWPDLQSHHQIHAIKDCESIVETVSGVDKPSNSTTVCVNPYHYERKKPASLDQVLVPVSRVPPDLSTSFEDSDSSARATTLHTRVRLSTTITGETVQTLLSPNSPMLLSCLTDSQQAEQPPQTSSNLPPPTGRSIPCQNNSEMNAMDDQQYQQQVNNQPHEQQKQQKQQSRQVQPLQQQYEPNLPQPRFEAPQQTIQQFDIQPFHIPRQQSQFEQGSQTQPQVQPYQQSYNQEQQSYQQQYQSFQQQPYRQPYPQTSQHQFQQHQQVQEQFQQPRQPAQPFLQFQQQGQYESANYSQGQLTDNQSNQQHYHPYQPAPSHPHQQYQNSPSQPMTSTTKLCETVVNTATEIANPYRFKQNKFAHIARNKHDHSLISQHPSYDPHGYITQPYTYTRAQPQSNQALTTQQQQQVVTSSSQVDQYSTMSPATSFATPATPSQVGQNRMDYQQSSVPMTEGGQVFYDENQTDNVVISLDFTEIPFPDGLNWCSVSYHEYDTRVGEKYHPNCFCFSVDGYTHPMCNDRFCIGGISNINRNSFTEWVRRRIGSGVRFTYIDGEVYVECLSDSSIFVSTPMLGIEEGKDNVDTVTKVTHGASVKVFSTPQFSKLLANAAPRGFEAVYKLTGYCSFRVSFVKGWGRNYKRQSILNAPCWVEVQLNGPMQWIDKVLRQMRPPSQGCGSTS